MNKTSMHYPLLFTLFTLGFFGGFSHCSSMCAPFVLTQVGNRLQKTSLQNFSNFEKLKHFALLPYHFGRITTYTMIAFFCSLFSNNIFDHQNFRYISSILLIISTLFFLDILLEKKLSSKFYFRIRIPLKKSSFFKEIMTYLFQNPQGFKGYLLGIILGFIPCGMLYGAFAIAIAMPSPFMAALGMIIFGIATFPALFLTASGSYFLLNIKVKNFSFLLKIIATINIAMLLMMAYNNISTF